MPVFLPARPGMYEWGIVGVLLGRCVLNFRYSGGGGEGGV